MGINKSTMKFNFGYPRSRDRGLRHQKSRKNDHFCVENLLIRLLPQNGQSPCNMPSKV